MATKIVNGERVQMTPEELAAHQESMMPDRADYIRRVKQKARDVRDGGTIINGLELATDTEARSLLLGGKVNPKSARKIVAKGGRKQVTGSEMTALVEGVDDFVQAVMDREFDLLEEIDAAADADLPTIDIDSGWPS